MNFHSRPLKKFVAFEWILPLERLTITFIFHGTKFVSWSCLAFLFSDEWYRKSVSYLTVAGVISPYPNQNLHLTKKWSGHICWKALLVFEAKKRRLVKLKLVDRSCYDCRFYNMENAGTSQILLLPSSFVSMAFWKWRVLNKCDNELSCRSRNHIIETKPVCRNMLQCSCHNNVRLLMLEINCWHRKSSSYLTVWCCVLVLASAERECLLA